MQAPARFGRLVPALQRSNVELVTTGLREITTDAVVAADGSPRRVDTIVLGTGFAAKLGIATSAFPNFFMMLGPNTALGHNSMVFMIEDQTRYVIGAIKYAREGDKGSRPAPGDSGERLRKDSAVDEEDRLGIRRLPQLVPVGGRPHRHAVAGYDCLLLVADVAIQAR
ncbi:hypothetical protein [Streptomyces phaeochromogenes]